MNPHRLGARPARERFAQVQEIMGIPISIHVMMHASELDTVARSAIDACFAELRDIDGVFSPYRDDSDICRIARGELSLRDADPRVAEVALQCKVAALETSGKFSAMWQGWFDPTGYVKGWSVENAARRHLAPLVSGGGSTLDAAARADAVGINAGGDMQLFTAADSDWRWNVGIADPGNPGDVIATLPISNGAVATSGPAERGLHIIDPRTGHRARGVTSATVVADSLTHADLWATAAMVAGFEDRSWVAQAGTRTGIVIADDGRVARWLGGTTVDVVAARTTGKPCNLPLLGPGVPLTHLYPCPLP